MAQKKTHWTLLHLFLSVTALSVVVVASLLLPGFKTVLKFYNRLNEKKNKDQKRAVSLPSLVLLPTLPSWWLLLRSQKSLHVTALIFHLHPPQYLWGFLRGCVCQLPWMGGYQKEQPGVKLFILWGKPGPALITRGQKWPLVGICNGESLGLFKSIHPAGYTCPRMFLQNGKKRFSGFIG